MSKLQSLKKRAFLNPGVKKEYEALSEEFALINNLLKMRTAANLTQQELAKILGTQKSNICRIEKGNTNPSFKMLTRYANACGYQIDINFHPL